MRAEPIAYPEMPPGATVVSCDMDKGRRLAMLVQTGDRTIVLADGVGCELPDCAGTISGVRWLGPEILSWPLRLPDGGAGSALVSPKGWRWSTFGSPREVFAARKAIFASYGEGAILTAGEGSAADDYITVYSPDGDRRFGAESLMAATRYQPSFSELGHGVLLGEDRLAFLADDEPYVWTLDATRATLSAVMPSQPVGRVGAYDALLSRGEEVGLLTLNAEGARVA